VAQTLSSGLHACRERVQPLPCGLGARFEQVGIGALEHRHAGSPEAGDVARRDAKPGGLQPRRRPRSRRMTSGISITMRMTVGSTEDPPTLAAIGRHPHIGSSVSRRRSAGGRGNGETGCNSPTTGARRTAPRYRRPILGVRLRATGDRGRVNLTYRLGHVE